MESALRRFRLGIPESDCARGPFGENGEWIVFKVSWAAALVNAVVRSLFVDLRNRYSVYLDFPQYTIWRRCGERKCSVDALAERGTKKTVGWVEIKWTRGDVARAKSSWEQGWEKVQEFQKIVAEAKEWHLNPNLGGGPIRSPVWYGVLVVSPTRYSLQLDSKAGLVLNGCLDGVGETSLTQGSAASGAEVMAVEALAVGGGGGEQLRRRSGRSGVRQSGHGWDQGAQGEEARRQYRASDAGFETDLRGNAKRNLNHSAIALRTRSRTPTVPTG